MTWGWPGPVSGHQLTFLQPVPVSKPQHLTAAPADQPARDVLHLSDTQGRPHMHTGHTLSPKPPLCLPFCATIRHHAGHPVSTHGEETPSKGEHSFSERGANKGNGAAGMEGHRATREQGRPKQKPSMMRHRVCKAGSLGPALTMVHETVIAQAHAKRHCFLPCLAVPLKRNRRGCSEGS